MPQVKPASAAGNTDKPEARRAQPPPNGGVQVTPSDGATSYLLQPPALGP
jgi:hypothetical protein